MRRIEDLPAKEAGASNAAGRTSASTTAKEASASIAVGRASASSTAKDTAASNAVGWESASTTAKGETARIAGGRLVLANRTEEVQLPLVRQCKTWLCQGLLASILRYTHSWNNIKVACDMHRQKHATQTSTHTHQHTRTHATHTMHLSYCWIIT